MLRLGNILTYFFDLGQDGIGCGGPDEGLGLSVVMTGEVIDFRGQVHDAPERASSDRLLGDDVEPDLHLVQPGSISRGQMDVEVGMARPASASPGHACGWRSCRRPDGRRAPEGRWRRCASGDVILELKFLIITWDELDV